MKRNRVLNDQIQRTVADVTRALVGMGKPENDYALCVELATDGMQELVELNKVFQAHVHAGTLLDELEVYTETIYHTPWHDLIQYWRLLPGSDAPEHLFPGCPGAFDFKDAARDREMEWPDAVFVSPTLFLDAIGEEDRAPFANALEQSKPAPGGVCVQCERTVTALNSAGVCEGCVMQVAIDAMQESEY